MKTLPVLPGQAASSRPSPVEIWQILLSRLLDHWSSNQSRFSQHGTNIFGEKLVTGSWSAQRVSNQCS